jgi:hypothetical protein
MEGVPYWKLTSENQPTFNGTSLKLPTLKNPTLTFDLTHIQVVSFKCNHLFLFKPTRSSNMGLELS